jgi:hypothetical protein
VYDILVNEIVAFIKEKSATGGPGYFVESRKMVLLK